MEDKFKQLLDTWPIAIDPELICDETSEEDKIQRAKNILSFFVQMPVEGKRVLDFGCGEGHTAIEARNEGAEAFGYDVKKSWNDNSFLHTNIEDVIALKPYDIIILYDVLDHTNDMEECMHIVKKLCNKDTIVYVLTHPWCGRHGGHLYRKFNYAFAHFFEECENIIKVVNPIMVYKDVFKTCGFIIEQEEVIKESVEDFFKLHPMGEAILDKFNSIRDAFKEFPIFQMEQSFHEYVLKINDL